MPCRISSSVGLGLSVSSASAERIIAGVQYPHCRPWFSMKHSWIG
jgi:hypothetical protein